GAHSRHDDARGCAHGPPGARPRDGAGTGRIDAAARPRGAGRARRRALRRGAGAPDDPARRGAGHGRTLRRLRGEPARRAGARARRKGAGPPRRSSAHDAGGRRARRQGRAPPPPRAQLRGRGRRRRRASGGRRRPRGGARDAAMTRPPWTARLALRVRRGMGIRIGERRVPGRPQPSGIEVESYAAYVAGDDLRHLDWNALARLDVALVRRFVAEREAEFHLLLDLSASMDAPARDRKLAAARELALAFAAIALGGTAAVRLALRPGGEAPVVSGVLRRGAMRDVATALAAATARGPGDLGAALEVHARRCSRPAVALVISD